MNTHVSELPFKIWGTYVFLFALSGNPKIEKFKENSKKWVATSYAWTNCLLVVIYLCSYKNDHKNRGESLRRLNTIHM